MCASGTALALHFGLWVSSVQSTSLPHALLFVSATPVVLAGAALARRVPLSRGELAGTACAMLGALVLVSDARSDTQARARTRTRVAPRAA
jgi:drug/metabolite transporter (DMT)-like permease